ncbi:MAG: lysostaphin resistance A-like protein [Candidatus Babeliales bacterium]
MLKTYTYKPLSFFLTAFTISWALWACAIYVSWQPTMQSLLMPLVLGGIAGPALASLFILIKSQNKELWHDFIERLRPGRITKKFIPVVLFLFPCQIILAIAISLLFGQSADQFGLSTQSSDQVLQGINALMIIVVVFLVGPLEELGWRGYGIDSLKTKFSLFKASLLLGVIWGAWHVPLFLIKNGAYQEIWSLGLVHTSLYFVDLVLLTIINNWLYYKNNRSILVAIMFHSILDICMSIFHITPVTWIILTFILLFTSIIIIRKDKELFFNK